VNVSSNPEARYVGVPEMFLAMNRFQPPPPEGAGSPFQWGDESYVEGLLGDAFELEFHEAARRFDSTLATLPT
jgi:hypothetical protein